MRSKLKQLALLKQGLTSSSFGVGLAGTRHAIEQLGYVQIDTLSVVERAHHHILWNRVVDYAPADLNRLIQQQHIFEYWFHAASYLPMRDYRYALPNMTSIRQGENRYYQNVEQKLMDEILARVTAEGALRLRHIDKTQRHQGGWWNWGAGRRAVDRLFMQGDLMVCERNGMEKVYDLATRCLPENIDLTLPTQHEYAGYLFDTTLKAHGIFTKKQLLHLKTGKPIRDAMQAVLEARIKAGVVEEYNTENGFKAYVDRAALEQVTTHKPEVKILSPFDNLIIHRDRLNGLFDFDYRMECYVPAAKRKYGYFCLPILYGNQFVARMDCKAHRSEQRLELISLHVEAQQTFDQAQFFPAFEQALQLFADFNQCPIVDMRAIKS